MELVCRDARGRCECETGLQRFLCSCWRGMGGREVKLRCWGVVGGCGGEQAACALVCRNGILVVLRDVASEKRESDIAGELARKLRDFGVRCVRF